MLTQVVKETIAMGFWIKLKSMVNNLQN